MQHIPCGKLHGGAAQKLQAAKLRRIRQKAEGILQLIAKAVCPAGLIISASAKEPRPQNLPRQKAFRERGKSGQTTRKTIFPQENGPLLGSPEQILKFARRLISGKRKMHLRAPRFALPQTIQRLPCAEI